MSVSVSMPQLGESVTEGTVTRWLKHEGDHVSADEPLLEVSTDKVDTEIPSPVSGILRGITVAEDETVAVGAELAVIDEDGAPPAGEEAAVAHEPPGYQDQPYQEQPAAQQPAAYQAPAGYQAPAPYQEPAPAYQPYAEPPASHQAPPGAEPGYAEPAAAPPAAYQPAHAESAPPVAYQPLSPPYEPGYQPAAGHAEPVAGYAEPVAAPAAEEPAAAPRSTEGAESPYVTPLVRKLAAEHDIDLGTVRGTGVGGRIRKQDVLDAARQVRGQEAPRPAPPATHAAATVTAAPAPGAAQPESGAAPLPKTVPAPSNLRGTTERLSRARQVIAQRMVESLQTSAQLTTVAEADVTAIARLRDRIKSAFEAREGVKLSFLPFFALAAVEALKAHPKLNAVIDTAAGTVSYHDAEHLGIAVDTDRGLMVPVIRNAGDLNIGGLARKIADLAARTRAGQVGPDDLTGGTFTLTNTGSRGALFDTPIINQPQVGILGTGTVNKRAVVVDDPDLGEVITVRSIVYLALTYDHRLVDGADAARFLVTIKNRLEEGAFEAEFGR
jgi:pyruvate dehydrogenase E2 component (dihydrolipoyllysine-residue acetyltransferase)